jgi:LacI family transcriptional regulator
MPPRLKDIARDLGVSVMTVSKALRGHADIGAATRARVIGRARELGYEPNRAARALVTGRSSALGLVVPDLVHPFFAEVARALGRVLRERRMSLVIASSEEEPALERQQIDVLVAQGVDALVVASVQTSAEALRPLAARRLPLVLLDRKLPGLAAPFLGVDDEQVGFLAADHLAAVGCGRIAHIRGPDTTPGRGRLAGYRRALARRRLPAPASYVVAARAPDLDGVGSGAEAMKELLARTPRPDGVVCFNDPVALGALRAIFEAGLRVPEDVAVVGAGNLLYDELLRVPLTSVDQQCGALGERAAAVAIELIERAPGRARRHPDVLLAPRLVPPASTARA